MCGIFGVLNSNPAAPVALEAFMRDGYIASGVRGTDSSGMFQIDKVGDIYWHKLPMDGTQFINNKVTQAMIADVDIKCMSVGHVRKATEGKVKLDNAHPFITEEDDKGDRIIGVHNGSLTGWKNKPNGYKYDVDSEWAINRIQEKGIKAFEDFDGSYAFVWYDTRNPRVINVARNKDRTLYYAFLEKEENKVAVRQKTVLLSSEYGMLAWLASRNSLTIEDKIYQFEPGFHYQFDIDDVTKVTKKALPAVYVWQGVVPDRFNHKVGDQYNPYTRTNMVAAVKAALNDRAVQDAAAKVKVPGIGLATEEEVKNAKDAGELGNEFDFIPLRWDPLKSEMYGAIDLQTPGQSGIITETCEAVLRGVSKEAGEGMKAGKYTQISAHCIGMYYEPLAGHTDVDLIYVLACPHYTVVPLRLPKPN